MLNTIALLSYNYSYQSSSTHHFPTALFVVFIIVSFAVGIVELVALWKIFKKAGRQGWEAIIPFYNYWVLFELAGKPGWWALVGLLSFIPFVGWIPITVLYVIAMLELAKRFGKSSLFAVFGMVIFSVVGWPILAFSDAKYSAGETPQSPTPLATPPASSDVPPLTPPSVPPASESPMPPAPTVSPTEPLPQTPPDLQPPVNPAQ